MKGLDASKLKEAKRWDECTLSAEGLSHEDREQLKDPKLKQTKGSLSFDASQTVPDQRFDRQVAACLRKEQIKYQGPSPLWPRLGKRWQHEDYWHAKHPKAVICDLNTEDELYPVLERFIRATSDNMSYQSMRFEFARLKKAAEDGKLTTFIQQEFKRPPTHEGKPGSIKIRAIQVNYHPELWQRYQARKAEIKQSLAQQNIQNPLAGVSWHGSGMVSSLPVLNKAIGECWLMHGTSPSVLPLITQNGFTTKFATKKPGWPPSRASIPGTA